MRGELAADCRPKTIHGAYTVNVRCEHVKDIVMDPADQRRELEDDGGDKPLIMKGGEYALMREWRRRGLHEKLEKESASTLIVSESFFPGLIIEPLRDGGLGVRAHPSLMANGGAIDREREARLLPEAL